MRMKLLSVRIGGIAATAAGADVGATVLGRIDELERAAGRFFLRFGIHRVDVVHLGTQSVDFYTADTDPSLQLDCLKEEKLHATVSAMKSKFNDGLSRYELARGKNVAVSKSPEDPAVLALNQAAWNLVGSAGAMELMPDEVADCNLLPRDPATLRLVQNDEPVEQLIDEALVTGVRVVSDFRFDMFPDLETLHEVLITLAGDIPEIQHRMSIQELQDLFHGYTLVSARVSGRKGNLPKVTGKIATKRCE